MLNLIKMDLYRMFHTLSTWITILFTAGMALFCVVMVQGDLDAMAEDPAYAQEMEQEIESASDGNEDRQLGLYAESDPEWIEGKIEAGEFISTQLQSGLFTCLLFTSDPAPGRDKVDLWLLRNFLRQTNT